MNIPLTTLLCLIAFCALSHGDELARPIVVKSPNTKTTLLMGSGKEGESKIHVHIMRGSAILHVVFDKDKQIENKIELSEQNSVTITAHAVGVEAKDGEVLGFYQIEPPKAPAAAAAPKPGSVQDASTGQDVPVIPRVRPGSQNGQPEQADQNGEASE